MFLPSSESTVVFTYHSESMGDDLGTSKLMNPDQEISKGQLSLKDCNLVHRLIAKGCDRSVNFLLDEFTV